MVTPARQSTKLAIIDDNSLVRELLANQLSACEEVEVIGTAGSIAEATELMENCDPDMVMTEIAMPDGPGLEWIFNLKESSPKIKVLVLTSCRQEQTMLSAISMGVEGYLLKTVSYHELLQSIKRIASGSYVFDQALAVPTIRRIAMSYGAVHGKHQGSYLEELTPRERQIAALASEGLTNEQIAEAMFVTVNTVKTHLRRIYKRLGVTSRKDLVQIRMLPNSDADEPGDVQFRI